MFNKKINHIKTPQWLTGLLVFLLVFVPLFVVWLLIGEWNLLNEFWIVQQGSILIWATNTTDVSKVADIYGDYTSQELISDFVTKGPTLAEGDKIGLVASFITFNPMFLLVTFGSLFLANIITIGFKYLRICYFDVLPFLNSIGILMIVLMILTVIPIWDPNSSAVIVGVWIIRFLIAIFIGFAALVCASSLTNKFISSRPEASLFFQDLKNDEKANAIREKQLKESIDLFKKDGGKDYIDVMEKK